MKTLFIGRPVGEGGIARDENPAYWKAWGG